MKIGVIAIQGDVEEHIKALKATLAERGENGEVIRIKHRGIVSSCDAIVIPGGESTTIGRLMEREGITEELRDAAEEGKPLLGTCAGMILLAREGDEEVKKTGQPLLGLMDVRVKRNAFGRQRESFEAPLKMSIFDEPFPGVFIRAPCITHAADTVDVLATLDDDINRIVAARQGNIMALAFHPELTGDRRIHHYFLDTLL
ncbi:MAG: pyridoxal 5'-phosphate synthase glutaminase subunit PdxT [Methanophagales archaeon]|nr:pyridoxal 5'-phosphate synthase glutaminase subunit PdxT [Methanophagales archaeon]MCW3138902.1 pyridoxal 5'-phosphate synthase glutaminase subunit PdxT [Methanophagales archaeon]MCW3139921.1 pyridoxal 5'-phosphate synthase glutaminase subunit PdxT [Methanophagales archaeon]MCW7070203.1 pyridoxal 5'-phosphate synthase glutaminase subunit PdxT [Methanophagales archaeon]MCW7074024.1 pyridoxal 5'-phosphate synthase glutaminase subunit PdxT [Methanophagales archaeon]